MKFAVKKLTRSDLTFIEPLFRKLAAGNQKSINLNADVFVDQLYPGVVEAARAAENEIPIKLSIYGPGAAPEYKLARKIVKGSAYKNWRLNGEFVRDPEGQPGRFDDLVPGDLAIMGFEGEPAPTGMKLIFVASRREEDAPLHKKFESFMSKRSMTALKPSQLSDLVSAAPSGHPVGVIYLDEATAGDVEDAALGGVDGIEGLLRNPAIRQLSATDLAKARTKAEDLGSDGEGLVDNLLEAEKTAGLLLSVAWSSISNAISPYDFIVKSADGQTLKIVAKSTSGPFERNFHISLAELREAAQDGAKYHIYRVFDLNNDGGKLRRSHDITGLARQVLDALSALPLGVLPDSFSIRTSLLTWGDEEVLQRADEPESDG